MSEKKSSRREKLIALAASSMVVGAAMGLPAEIEASEMLAFTSLGSGGQVRSQLMASKGSRGQLAEGHGQKKKGYGKSKPARKSKCCGKSNESKAGEGKCGEGKCGEGKCGEGKCGEGKCGEGKCGEGKAGEGKCGEGRCGR